MEETWNCKGSPLQLAPLHLLVPPVRLMSAFMWQVVQLCNVIQYDKLAEFISLVTEMVPDLLTSSQSAQLILGLRARLVLELCRSDSLANMEMIQNHLDKIHMCITDLSPTHQENSKEALMTSYTNFASLVQKLLNVPFEKEYFFQEVFPAKYGSAYDLKLQQLVSEFLSRLEQLLPAPDFKQTAAWLPEDPSVKETFGQHLSDPAALKALLLHHRQLGTLSDGPSSSVEDTILFALAVPSEAEVEKYYELDGVQEGNYDREERLVMEDSEDNKDLSQSPNLTADEGMPIKKSGQLSKLYICPQYSFAHQTKKKVCEHIQGEHQLREPPEIKKLVRKSRRKTEQKQKDSIVRPQKRKVDSEKKKNKEKDPSRKKREHKQRKDNSENQKEPCKQKEPRREDRRFLSTRLVSKNLTEEEKICPECGKVFDLPNQLKNHLKLHTLPYCCIQCEKGFTSKSGFYQHNRLHKKGRRFICPHCNKGFLCSYSLKQHERKHTEGHNNLCPVCGRRFSKLGIVRHMLMHRGEKNYLCTTCGKSFLSSGELGVHSRSHTGETPYTCNHCGKGFSNTSHLIVHVRSHTGERPYPCVQCTKRFLTLSCLKRHMLTHDGVKPFKCTNCEKEFSQLGNLKRHLRTH
ncbi:zinc finger protein 391-like [Lampris incognitus]|uniref:zinc finger protein 391-like n=1 Tax=Lampris incognitus TaxID=2546036 RepID=UPI0024B49D70|nr:zinc finger protein 391-like [Lampris incognitus]